MNNYCVLDKKNVITNIIVCENDKSAKDFNAYPYYDGAKIGTEYLRKIDPTQLDKLEAQTTYMAMMTNTLLKED